MKKNEISLSRLVEFIEKLYLASTAAAAAVPTAAFVGVAAAAAVAAFTDAVCESDVESDTCKAIPIVRH